jgi:IS30 family transposase
MLLGSPLLPVPYAQIFDSIPPLTEQELNTPLTLPISSYIEVAEPRALNIAPLGPEKRAEALKTVHLMGHGGTKAMYESLLQQQIYWKDMYSDCHKEFLRCATCQRYNITQNGFHPLSSINARLPFEHIAVDLKEMCQSHDGYKYILVLVDVATRFVFLRKLKDKTMNTLTQTLFEIFCDIGFPNIIQSDNGS